MKKLQEAAEMAFKHKGHKNFLLGCIAKRQDGTFVRSVNIVGVSPMPSAHAEARVLKKAGSGSILWVSRVLKDGAWAMAKPCSTCQALIKNKKVKKVYYTIGPNEYGVWYPS